MFLQVSLSEVSVVKYPSRFIVFAVKSTELPCPCASSSKTMVLISMNGLWSVNCWATFVCNANFWASLFAGKVALGLEMFGALT